MPEPLAVYEITPANLLHTLSGGRSAALVPWCNHYQIDVGHVLDVLEGRDQANEDMKRALIAYCWLNPAQAQRDAEPDAQVPAVDPTNVVYISELLNELVDEVA